MNTATYETLQTYQHAYRIAPIRKQLMADQITPICLLEKLKSASKHCYLLESVEKQQSWGRYTFLGYDPTHCITASGNHVTLHNLRTKQTQVISPANPIAIIRQFLTDYTSPKVDGFPPFTGGLVGYFSYDFIKYSEPKLILDGDDKEGFQDIDLMLFDKVIVFDHLEQKINLIANVFLDSLESDYQRALDEIDAMEEIILHGLQIPIPAPVLKSSFSSLFSAEQYISMVERAKNYIYEGDIFQVVLSNRMKAKMEGSLFQMYRVLRTVNPSPYMFYLSGEDLEVAGASPETLVKLENGILHTFPLAGTRKRGSTPQEDLFLEQDLLADEKEKAEHNMLVDLGRNDLGKISQYGSVSVESYMEIQRYSHVMHIGSTVKGTIKAEYDALDAIAAVLPAGTLSGAPKFRACQIINELENNKRGIYGGAIGYIDFTGNMDTCIGIRIAYKKGENVFVRSGAGIVADSVPEIEHEECINKAKAVIQSIIQSSSKSDSHKEEGK